MFGPYEITRNGRTWHGNVALKEHRILECEGAHCLFLVPDMAALPVSAALAAAIAGLTPGFSTLVPDGLMRALRGCGLVEEAEQEAEDAAAGTEAKDEAAAAPAGTDAPAAPPTFPVLHIALFLTQTCNLCLLYTSPSPRDRTRSRMPSSA